MFVDKVPNRKSNPTWLIRESKWVDGRAVKNTLANLTKLPPPLIQAIDLFLKGGTVIKSLEEAFDIQSSKIHGPVAAVLGMINQLGLPGLITPKNSRFRRVIVGMIAARVIQPQSKLSTSILLDAQTAPNTLNEELALKRVDEDDLYAAMDELCKRKTEIECRLAKRHLREGSLVLYDVTSSYVEGEKNEWAAYGYNRDRKNGKKQIVFGLMTDPEGCPVSVEVFHGNTADTATLRTQVEKIQKTFGLKQVVLVEDRGMLKQKQIQEEILPVGLDWIIAMQKHEIREVVEQKSFQMSLFDEQDLVEVCCDLYPKERLVLCKNPLRAKANQEMREALLVKTEKKLDQIVAAVQKGRLKEEGKIGLRVGKWVNKYKMNKYFTLEIRRGHFSYRRNLQAIAKAEQLDGLYAIRSSLQPESDAAELVRDYKRLSKVEMAFRTMKSMSLQVRPIHHRKKDRVVAHVFLCMLAYYVEYHMRRALAPMLFAEETSGQTDTPLDTTEKKARTKRTHDGEKAMSFRSLMEQLSTLSRIRVRPEISIEKNPEIVMLNPITPFQTKVFELLKIKPL